MDPWVDLFSKVGFPVAVAGFVLIRLNGKLERLTAALTAFSERLDRLLDRLDSRGG